MNGYVRFLVPLGLAAAAALANYAVFKRHTSKVEVCVVNADVSEGTVITADKLDFIKVQGDEALFPSALRPENLGEVMNLPARRNLRAGEVLLRADLVRQLLPLNTGEHSWTVHVPVPAASDLTPGAHVQLVVSPGDGTKARAFGPYRLRGWDAAEGAGKDRSRAYVLAVPNGDPGALLAQSWIDYGRGGSAVRSLSRVTDTPAARPAR